MEIIYMPLKPLGCRNFKQIYVALSIKLFSYISAQMKQRGEKASVFFPFTSRCVFLSSLLLLKITAELLPVQKKNFFCCDKMYVITKAP
jgi:hypothetical protein